MSKQEESVQEWWSVEVGDANRQSGLPQEF